MSLNPEVWYPSDCEQALSTGKLRSRNRWVAGEGKASGTDRQPDAAASMALPLSKP